MFFLQAEKLGKNSNNNSPVCQSIKWINPRELKVKNTKHHISNIYMLSFWHI